MSTDIDLEECLCRAVGSLAQLAALENPEWPRPHDRTAARFRRRRRLLWPVGAAVAAASLAIALLAGGLRGPARVSVRVGSTPPLTPSVPSGATATPSQVVPLPNLLPPPGFQIMSIDVARAPAPVPVTGTYVQAYEGSPASAPARLVIATTEAAPGALDGYGGTDVTVGGHRALYLGSEEGSRVEQLLWQDGDGAVISLEAEGISAGTLEALAAEVSRAPAAPGVTLSGALPDGLHPVGAGYYVPVGITPPGTVTYMGIWCCSKTGRAPVTCRSGRTPRPTSRPTR